MGQPFNYDPKSLTCQTMSTFLSYIYTTWTHQPKKRSATVIFQQRLREMLLTKTTFSKECKILLRAIPSTLNVFFNLWRRRGRLKSGSLKLNVWYTLNTCIQKLVHRLKQYHTQTRLIQFMYSWFKRYAQLYWALNEKSVYTLNSFCFLPFY